MKTLHTLATLALCTTFAFGTLGCDKKEEKKEDKKAESKKADAKADAKAADVKAADAKEAVDEAPPPEEAVAPTGPQPSNDKEFLGLELEPQGDWKPEWDADAKVAKWVHDDFMSGIIIRVVSDSLTNMDELKAAAPMMMQVGTAISSVTTDKQDTERGWSTVVKYDDDKGEVYLDIAVINGVTVVCSANLDSSMGEAIKLETAQKACSSYRLKE